MRRLPIEELSVETFLPFGYFQTCIDPQAVKIGAPPIEFYRDMLQLDMGGAGMPSFGVCRVEKRDMVISVSEYHNATGEGIMPLDNDICFYVGPATPPGDDMPLDQFRVFSAPRGTMIVLHPGVWHHAPFTLNDQPVNCLIVLPPRTYANDCHVVTIPEKDWIAIQRS